LTYLSQVGKDARLVLATRSLRALSYGFLGVIMAIYLALLGLQPFQVGAVITGSLVANAVLATAGGLAAARWGRRRVLMAFASLSAISGAMLSLSQEPSVVVVAMLIGSKTTGTDAGPFRAVEQVVMPRLVKDTERTQLFGVYYVFGYVFAALGAALANLPAYLQSSAGLQPAASLRPLFYLYTAASLVNLLLYSLLSPAAEADGEGGGRLIPKKSLGIVAKLSALYGVDALGGGLIVPGFLSYWLFLRFGVDTSSLGGFFFASYFVTATSLYVAVRLARKFGHVNTMVFTHLPSNVILMALAFAPSFYSAAALYLARSFLSEMDVPTRESYTMAIIPEDERASSSGFLTTTRSLYQAGGPALGGYLLQFLPFVNPIFLAGAIKASYDVSLYSLFRRVKTPEERRSA